MYRYLLCRLKRFLLNLNKLGQGKILLLVAIIIAIIFSSWGGAPYFHPDTVSHRGLKLFVNYGDPGFYNYPALTFYLHGIFYILSAPFYFIFMDDPARAFAIPSLINIPGHLVTVIFSIFGVYSLYKLGDELYEHKLSSLFSCLLLIFSPLWNSEAHYLTVDIPLASFCIFTVYVSYRTYINGILERRNILYLGLLIGLTAAVKYNGALIATSVALAIFFLASTFKQFIYGLFLSAATSIIVFLFLNPYILINFDSFYKDFFFEVNHSTVGHDGYDSISLIEIFSQSFSLFGIILSAVGFLIFCSAKKAFSDKLIILLFPLLFMLVVSFGGLRFYRYILPIMPFLALLSGFAIDKAICCNNKNMLVLVILALFTATLSVNTYRSSLHNILLQRSDTRELIQNLNLNSEKAHESIVVGPYIQKITKGLSRFKGELIKSDVDVIIFDSFSHDRYIIHDSGSPYKTEGLELYDKIIAISPFTLPKEKIPYSQKSVYSPFAPDIFLREFPGPYIEIAFKSKESFDYFHSQLDMSNPQVKILEITESYYLMK